MNWDELCVRVLDEFCFVCSFLLLFFKFFFSSYFQLTRRRTIVCDFISRIKACACVSKVDSHICALISVGHIKDNAIDSFATFLFCLALSLSSHSKITQCAQFMLTSLHMPMHTRVCIRKYVWVLCHAMPCYAVFCALYTLFSCFRLKIKTVQWH